MNLLSTVRYRTHRPARRHGFSLAESIVAIALTSIAGSAVLLAISSAVQATSGAADRAIANGLAQQLVDEALGGRYAAVGAGPYQVGLGPNAMESAGAGRSLYDDTDDYHGFVAQPAKDSYGFELGQGNDQGGLRHPNFRLPSGYFAPWRQEVEVYYVNQNDPSVRLQGWDTSNLRAVEARVYRQDANQSREELAKVRRVYAYVPAPQ